MTVFQRFLVLFAVCSSAAPLGGCAERPLVVGVKDFTEQRVLAEVVRARAKAAGVRVEVKACRDTFGCQQKLRSGAVDVLFEYSGTGALHAGASLAQRQALDQATLNELYEPYGVRWLAPLGFSNGYRVVVTKALKQRLGIQSIADLSKLPNGVRVACPPTFLRRVGDGLGPLLDVHGLKIEGRPHLLRSPTERAAALWQDRVDVAIFYETDASATASGLSQLSDAAQFFPRYDAYVVARSEVVDGARGLLLEGLKDLMTTKQMQALNTAVDKTGFQPREVATQFVTGASGATSMKSRLVSVAHNLDDTTDAALQAEALRMVRAALGGRPVVAKQSKAPIVELARGARFSVVSIGRLFRKGRKGMTKRVDAAEAAVVVGTRHLHLMKKDCTSSPTSWGVQPVGGAGGAALAYLKASKKEPTLQMTAADLIDAVVQGSVDAALISAPLGTPQVTKGMQQGVQLCSLDDAPTPMWLRRAVVPAGTYPLQAVELVTRSEQMVLAGPRPQRDSARSPVGPAAALSTRAPSVSSRELEALRQATPAFESPDPAVHSTWARLSATAADEDGHGSLNTLIALLLMLFVGWTLHQTFVVAPSGLPNSES